MLTDLEAVFRSPQVGIGPAAHLPSQRGSGRRASVHHCSGLPGGTDPAPQTERAWLPGKLVDATPYFCGAIPGHCHLQAKGWPDSAYQKDQRGRTETATALRGVGPFSFSGWREEDGEMKAKARI